MVVHSFLKRNYYEEVETLETARCVQQEIIKFFPSHANLLTIGGIDKAQPPKSCWRRSIVFPSDVSFKALSLQSACVPVSTFLPNGVSLTPETFQPHCLLETPFVSLGPTWSNTSNLWGAAANLVSSSAPQTVSGTVISDHVSLSPVLASD